MGDRFRKKGINTDSITNDFKRLIFRLLCYDPEKRITIEELQFDPWFKSQDYNRNKTRRVLALSYMAIIQEK